MAITTKTGMYELYAAGLFGNRPVYFDSVEAYMGSDFEKPVGIRNRVAGSRFCDCRPHTREDVAKQLGVWIGEGLDLSTVVISESASHWIQTMNAEVMRDHCGLSVFWSPVQKVMRDALAERAYRWSGLQALLLLQQRLDAPSYDNLFDLLERYSDHVIELTSFTRGIGVLGWNTLFWEVRKY